MGRYLALLFTHGTFVKEAIRFLFQRLNVVLIQKFGTIQLLDQLLVNARFTWSSFCAKLDVYEVEYAILELFAVCLGLMRRFFAVLWTVIGVVQVLVDLLSDTQILGLL